MLFMMLLRALVICFIQSTNHTYMLLGIFTGVCLSRYKVHYVGVKKHRTTTLVTYLVLLQNNNDDI